MALKYATITLIMIVLLTSDSSIHWDESRLSAFTELTQIGRTEKRIRDTQDQGQKVLLYTLARWPQVSNINQ